MDLKGELENARHYTAKRGPLCTVCQLIGTLTPDEKVALESAFASDLMTTAIRQALINSGHRIAAWTLNRHRKGECRGAA